MRYPGALGSGAMRGVAAALFVVLGVLALFARNSVS
jgi:hypothetical protein